MWISCLVNLPSANQTRTADHEIHIIGQTKFITFLGWFRYQHTEPRKTTPSKILCTYLTPLHWAIMMGFSCKSARMCIYWPVAMNGLSAVLVGPALSTFHDLCWPLLWPLDLSDDPMVGWPGSTGHHYSLAVVLAAVHYTVGTYIRRRGPVCLTVVCLQCYWLWRTEGH